MQPLRLAFPTVIDQYSTCLTVAADPCSPQPFGALGGASLCMQYIACRVNMFRVQTAYTCESFENAHAIITVRPSASASTPDLVEQCISAASLLPVDMDKMFASISGFSEASIRLSMSSPLPSWMPVSTNGRYAHTYNPILTALHNTQIRLSAYESCLAKPDTSQQAGAGAGAEHCLPAPCTSTVAAVAALQIEIMGTGSGLRWAAALDIQEMLKFMWDFVPSTQLPVARKEISSLRSQPAAAAWLEAWCDYTQSTHVAHCLEKQGAVEYTRLKGILQHEVLSVDDISSATDTSDVSTLAPCAIKPNDYVLHLTVVMAHPSARRSGYEAIQAACAVADHLRLPLMLEALPNAYLPLYYASKHKFRVACPAGSLVMAQAQWKRAGVVHMLRMPQPKVLFGPALPPSLVSQDALERMQRVLDTLRTQPQCPLQPYVGSRNLGRLRELHLSVATQQFIEQYAVLASDGSVLYHASWAAEFDRQFLDNEISSQYGPRRPSPSVFQLSAASPVRPVGRPLGMHKRSRVHDDVDDDASTARARTRRAQPQPPRDPGIPVAPPILRTPPRPLPVAPLMLPTGNSGGAAAMPVPPQSTGDAPLPLAAELSVPATASVRIETADTPTTLPSGGSAPWVFKFYGPVTLHVHH